MVAIIERVRLAYRAFVSPQQKNFPFPVNVYVDRYGYTQWSLIDYETYAKQGFAQNSVVYTAIKYKQDSIAQAPIRAYTGHPDDAEILDDLEHPLAQLSLRPNDYMSRVEFMQYCVTYLNIHGNCFVALTGINDNLPIGMYPLRPDRVFILPDKDTHGIKAYVYFPQGATEETAIPILPENMCHIKFVHPYDNLEGQGYGLSPMSAAAHVIDTDNNMTEFLARFFKNNGLMPGGVVTLPYDANPEDIAKMRDQIGDMYGGSNNWGKPLVIDGSGSFSHMIPSFQEMVLDNIDLRNARRSTSVFGVPARLIGLDEANSTYNNIQEAKDDFWQRTMSAELMLFEEEFRHKVRLGDDVFLRFDLSGIAAFADDTLSQVQAYSQLVSNFVPPNIAKVIAGINIPDMEGGDISYMPVGLVPVQQKQVELENLENQDNEESEEDNPFEDFEEDDTDSDMEDVPTPEDESEKSFNPIQLAIKKLAWDYDSKERFALKRDKLTESFEDKYANAANKQFEQDKRKILAIFSEQKKANHKAKQSFDYEQLKHAVRAYLRGDGLQAWRNRFSPLFVDINVASREQMEDDFELSSFIPMAEYKQQFTTRTSIEGEYWFSNYTLKFATAINKTTEDDIRAIIRDGLAEGWGTDKIGNKIELLFQQYIHGNISYDEFEFLVDRLPKWRTEMIARTETHGAMSAGNHAFYEIAGVPLKEWFATGDDRTRETHLRAWNEYSEGGSPGPIGIDDNFMVAGYECRHPGDRTLPLKEFIRCRCTELPYYLD